MPAHKRNNCLGDYRYKENRFGRAIINGFPVCNKVYFSLILILQRHVVLIIINGKK
jgi:hypothetical protein